MTQPILKCWFLTCISLYNKFGRTYLFQLDFYHLRPTESASSDDDEWQTKYVIDAYHAGNVSSMSINPLCYLTLNAVHSVSGVFMFINVDPL